ncbi:proprotein convertase P-domain-containing protein [Shewanella alkalitolerans]|uniref:proprotein convertase P-domain-containing protein n=1 Tax=Shewanella alkalitolerans TaxID=2864209 RepID=UPI001C65B5D9|nr:proprotein convertase P-domain-containing protein [Shewanella alkalitolerans]QYJ96152.1 proprotein convertase P-domain-containing protein [Shewanella alkalitolerans]
MKSNHSAAGLTYIQAGQTPEAQAVNNNRLSLFAILLLFMLTPFTHGSSEFRAYQSRYDDPLLNMVAEDRETLEKFNAQSKATIGSVEIKPKRISETNTKSKTPIASVQKEASATPEDKPTELTPGFVLSVKEKRLSRAAGETAIYHFSTLEDRTLVDNSHTATRLASEKLEEQICLSLASSLPGARLTKERIHPGDTFSLLVPSNSDAQWGDYMFTVTASADGGNWVKQQSVNLSLLPGDIREIQQANFTWQPITDNVPKGIESRITVEDELAAFGVRVLVNVSHTWHRDLSMTLTSPMGTSYQLESESYAAKESKTVKASNSSKESHAGRDNQHREYRTLAFNHEAIRGDWILQVSDLAAGDIGTLRGWQLLISGYSAAQPQDISASP